MKRLVEFDIAKAICIMLVVMGHYAVDKPAWWVTTHDIIYTFHMPLFMFASGYIYIAFKREESYMHFIWKKVKRLMIPYVTTSFVVVTIKLVSQSGLYVQNPVTLYSYLKIFYLPEAGYYLWFIWALWWMFCIIPLFQSRNTRIILFAASFVLHYSAPYLNLPVVFCLKQTANMLFWFMLGVECFDWKIGIAKVKGYFVVIVFAVFSFVLMMTSTSGFSFCGIENNSESGLLLIFRPYLGIISIICLSKWISQHSVPKALMSISFSSYIIYLFHTTFMGFARAVLMKVPFMQSQYVIAIVIVVATGVVCPLLLHWWLKNTKYVKFLFGLN